MTHYPNVSINQENLREALHTYILEEGAKRLASKPMRRKNRRFVFVPVWVNRELQEKAWFVASVKLDPTGIIAELFPEQGGFELVVTFDPETEYDDGWIVPGIRKSRYNY